jgi:hypothetical protein
VKELKTEQQFTEAHVRLYDHGLIANGKNRINHNARSVSMLSPGCKL